MRSSSVLNALLQIPTLADLQGHPKLGSSGEGFSLEQVIGILGTRDAYFWATHAGAELDLMVMVARAILLHKGREGGMTLFCQQKGDYDCPKIF